MTSSVLIASDAPQSTLDHAHHWKIDEPCGTTSMGFCKACGATRAFRNWLAESDFITNEDHRIAGTAA